MDSWESSRSAWLFLLSTSTLSQGANSIHALVRRMDGVCVGETIRKLWQRGKWVKGKRASYKSSDFRFNLTPCPFPPLPFLVTHAYLDRLSQLAARAVLSRVDSGVCRARSSG